MLCDVEGAQQSERVAMAASGAYTLAQPASQPGGSRLFACQQETPGHGRHLSECFAVRRHPVRMHRDTLRS